MEHKSIYPWQSVQPKLTQPPSGLLQPEAGRPDTGCFVIKALRLNLTSYNTVIEIQSKDFREAFCCGKKKSTILCFRQSLSALSM